MVIILGHGTLLHATREIFDFFYELCGVIIQSWLANPNDIILALDGDYNLHLTNLQSYFI